MMQAQAQSQPDAPPQQRQQKALGPGEPLETWLPSVRRLSTGLSTEIQTLSMVQSYLKHARENSTGAREEYGQLQGRVNESHQRLVVLRKQVDCLRSIDWMKMQSKDGVGT